MRSVVKHSYIKGSKGKSRAKAHVNYIANRAGPDRENGAREFFGRDRDDVSAKEVKQDIDRIDQPQVVAHKLILSPGIPGVDIRAYTREVLHAMGRYKGLDLDWRAVVHANTDNHHAHVVIFGKDLNGTRVRLNLDDCRFMRWAGDVYLERVHDLDRYLRCDGKLREVLDDPSFAREGDPLYQCLIKDIMASAREDEERRKRGDEIRDIDEHRQLDELLGLAYRTNDDRVRRKGREQRMHEARGRLTDAHVDYQEAMEMKRLEDLARSNPDNHDQIEGQIRELKEQSIARLSNSTGWREFDALVGADSETSELTKKKGEESGSCEDRELMPDPDSGERDQETMDERHFQDLHIQRHFFDRGDEEHDDRDERQFGLER